MGNEIMKMSEVAARNAAAEKAMADAIQTLEEALSDAAGLPEMERAAVYAERLGAVRVILCGEGGEVMSTPNQKIEGAK